MRVTVDVDGKVTVPPGTSDEVRKQVEVAVAEILAGGGELVEFDDDDNLIAPISKD